MNADDIVTICWTSGTEGVPKGVPRSHNHWISGSLCHYDGAQIRRGDRLLNPFPLVNMAALGGCFMSWLRAAGTLILHHPFELPVYLQQIATEKPEYAIAPPAVLMMLLQNEALLHGVDLSCLRCIGSGSAPLPPVMIQQLQGALRHRDHQQLRLERRRRAVQRPGRGAGSRNRARGCSRASAGRSSTGRSASPGSRTRA